MDLGSRVNHLASHPDSPNAGPLERSHKNEMTCWTRRVEVFNIEAGGSLLPCPLTSPPPTMWYLERLLFPISVCFKAECDPSPRVAKTGRCCGVHLKLLVIGHRHHGDIFRTAIGQRAGPGGPASCCRGPRKNRRPTQTGRRIRSWQPDDESHPPDLNAVGTLPSSGGRHLLLV